MSILPPQFAELVNLTKEPFIQTITDVLSSKALFMNNKLLLIGDAVAGFRPHPTAATSQAALHAILLDQAMRGEISWMEMERKMLNHAKTMSEIGIRMGEKSQFSGGR